MRTSLALSILLSIASSTYAAGTLGGAELTCEYLTNPIGIDTPKPRLTWQLESKQFGARQTAFQILVASTPELLAKDQGDLWDSGKVNSDTTIQIDCGGKPRTSFERAHWKVRVWDQNNIASEYSEPAFFEMGVLQPSDWQAKWISAPPQPPAKQPAGEPSPLFRKVVNFSKPVTSARAYICGLGYYELYINGWRVSDNVLDPAYTQYDKRILYVTHDVSTRFREGPNAIGIMLGDGFFNQWVPDVWHFEKAPWRSRPKVIAQINVTYADGSAETIVTDGSWKTAPSPIQESTTRAGEVYDARRELPGWDAADFDDSSWKSVELPDAPKAALRAQMCPPMRVTRTLPAVAVKEVKPGVFVFDIGQNMTGWARLTLPAAADGDRGGTLVQLRFAERLHPDGSLDPSNIDTFLDKTLFQTDTYVMKGQGTEIYEPRFVYHGFQYVEVSGFPGKLGVENLQGRVIHTDFPQVGSFECSNEIINKLQKATLWSYIGNFQSIPTDCPQREKNGWTGDAHLAADAGFYNFDNAAGYANWIQSVADSQFPDGFIPDVVPDPHWTMNAGPAWESVYILLPWTMYQYTGDTRILQQHWSGWVQLMERFASKAKNNLLRYGLNDWVAIKQTPAEYTVNGCYYLDAQIMAKVAAMLEQPTTSAEYAKLAQDIRKAYNDELFDKSTGYYKANTQTAQATALYQGLANEQDRQRIFDGLLKLLADNNNHPNTGVFGAHYLPRVLSDFGHVDLALQMMTQPTGPGWGEWIARGYTTLQENWGQGSSQNHIFFGNISAWFYNTLAGIRLDPQQPAWKHIIIKPYPGGDLKWVKASTKTIRGTIASSWTRDGAKFDLTVTIPPNCTATVYVPVTPNGRVIIAKAQEDFQKRLGVKDGYEAFEVQSGTYQFRASE